MATKAATRPTLASLLTVLRYTPAQGLDSGGGLAYTTAEEYIQAVEQKQIEAEKIIAEQYKRDQAKYQAEAAVELAKGEASATIERAKAEAERKKIIAEAEAEAIRVKGEVLAQYPEVIQFEFIQGLADPNSNVKWGIMPGGNLVPFLDITQLAMPAQQATPEEGSLSSALRSRKALSAWRHDETSSPGHLWLPRGKEKIHAPVIKRRCA